jgi:hypothetical protein
MKKYKPIFKFICKYCLMAVLILIFFANCKKLIEVDAPVTNTNATVVYSTDALAAAVLTGIYTNLSTSNIPSGGLTSMSFFPGLSSDELTLYPGSTTSAYVGLYTNQLNSSTLGTMDFWIKTYPTIFVANSAIEGLSGATALTPAVKQQLMGEAMFARAFCYFYLVNLYGDVPLAIGTDYTANSLLSKTPKAKIYQQIIADLKDAETLLSTNYLKADVLTVTTERVRPTKWAAAALLSRVYLFKGAYDSAEAQSTQVINNSQLYSLTRLDSVFYKNSNEAIWQLQPVGTGTSSNTGEGRLFILPATGPNTSNYPVYLSNFMVNSFETGDLRKVKWTGSVTVSVSGMPTTYYYPYKYKIGAVNSPMSEYSMVLRLGEQFLIRAEARAQQGNLTGAEADLNAIRNRAGLANTTATAKSDLMNAILHERQVELFTEWGHRWLDLKRTNTVDAIMGTVTPQKGGSWNTNWQWYPLSLYELQHDPNLAQNTGYVN